jgi:hypothetical protein
MEAVSAGTSGRGFLPIDEQPTLLICELAGAQNGNARHEAGHVEA